MSLVAPITSSYAILPAAVGIARGAVVGPVTGVGLILTLIGVLIVARAVPVREETVRVNQRGLILALAAAAALGGATALLQAAASARGGSALGAALVGAMTAALTASLARSLTIRRRSGPFQVNRLAIVAGGLSAAGVGLLALASRSADATTIVAVLTSLFSVWIILLARVLLHERLSRFQTAGVVCALIGVAIVSAA
jgi:drug/metabolite transporter (DMT)-like permease